MPSVPLTRKLFSAGADSDNDLLRKIADSLAIGLAARGHDLLTAAGVQTGEWRVLHAITAATVTIIRDGVSETFSLIAGDRVTGNITSVNATAGTVELYIAS